MTQAGTVKLFQPDKGFGFITAADGTDIFLHIKACTDGGIPQKGDVLSFDLTESQLKPGAKQAVNVTGGTGKKGEGKGIATGPTGTGSVQGSVKNFNPEKGFGFVIGPDGSDIFLHIKAVVDGTTPQAGDYVSYDPEANPAKPGQMRASNVTGGTGGGKGKGKDGGGYGAATNWDGGKGKGGPYGDGGKGDGWGGDWGGKGDMAWMMTMMDSWFGGKGDGWGGKGGKDGWGGKGEGWGGMDGKGESWGGKGDAWGGKGDAWGGKGEGWGKGWGGMDGKGEAWGGMGGKGEGWGGKDGCKGENCGFGGKNGCGDGGWSMDGCQGAPQGAMMNGGATMQAPFMAQQPWSGESMGAPNGMPTGQPGMMPPPPAVSPGGQQMQWSP